MILSQLTLTFEKGTSVYDTHMAKWRENTFFWYFLANWFVPGLKVSHIFKPLY